MPVTGISGATTFLPSPLIINSGSVSPECCTRCLANAEKRESERQWRHRARLKRALQCDAHSPNSESPLKTCSRNPPALGELSGIAPMWAILRSR